MCGETPVVRTKKLPVRLLSQLQKPQVSSREGGGDGGDLHQRFVWDMEAMQVLTDHGVAANEFILS